MTLANDKNAMTYDELIQQAEKYYNEHEYQQAVDYAAQAIELDKTKPDGYYWRGMSYWKQHKQEEILKNADALLKCTPNTALHFVYQGWAYNAKEEYEKTVNVCSEVLKKDDTEKEAYRYRAWAYLEMGKYDSAISDYNEMIKLDPQSAVAYNGLGEAYRRQGKFDIAIENYTKAIDIDEEYSAAYNNRGVAYSNRDSRKPNQVLPFLPNRQMINGFSNNSNFRGSKQTIGSITNNQNNAATYFYNGKKFYEDGNFPRAIANYNKYIEINPKSAPAYIDRGNSYARTGDFISAITSYSEAIKIDPKYPFAYFNLGISFANTDDFASAITNYNKSIDLDSKYPDSYYNRAIAYHEKQDYSSTAMIAYAEALKFFPYEDIFIESFLDAVESEKDNITPETKESFKKSPSDLVQLVGEVLCAIDEWDDCQKYIRLVREVYNLLKNLEEEKTKLEEENKNKKDIFFYQYVKGDSFIKNIVKEQERTLWLTPACYQNDPDEGKYIFNFFHSQFQSGPFMNLFKELTEKEDTGSGTPIAFIRSFSECKDDILMWNSSYAGNGAGVSLGVPFCKLIKAAKRPEYRSQKNIDELVMSTGISDKENQISSISPENQSKKLEKGEEKAIPMEQLYFARVLYLSLDEETEDHKKYEKHLNGIKDAINKFTKKYLDDSDNTQHFKKFLPRIFLPIAHLIKSVDYQHEKEWRLLYLTSIKEGKQFIKREPLHIETEEILFKDKEKKEEIWLGPNFGKHPELEKLKIQHLFEYDGIDDRVDIKISKKHFRG